jgi:hypothetical protein
MIDLRKVISSLLGIPSTLFPTSNKSLGFQWYGLRQADYTKRCACSLTTPSTTETCTRCLSTGYLFTDYLVKGYTWLGILGFEYGIPVGTMSTQSKNIAIQHNRTINKFDFVLELDQDLSGKIKQPFKITRYYRIQDVAQYRGDEGRLEFWKCYLEERNIDDGKPGSTGNSFEYKVNRRLNDIQ